MGKPLFRLFLFLLKRLGYRQVAGALEGDAADGERDAVDVAQDVVPEPDPEGSFFHVHTARAFFSLPGVTTGCCSLKIIRAGSSD